MVPARVAAGAQGAQGRRVWCGDQGGTGRVLTSLIRRLEPVVIVGLAPGGRVSIWGEAGRLW